MASAGPSDARTQPAWRGIATRAGEDAAARSLRVTCTVKQPKSAKRRNLRWSLHRAGRTLSHGRTSVARLQTVLNDLRPGTYALHVDGQEGATAIKIA